MISIQIKFVVFSNKEENLKDLNSILENQRLNPQQQGEKVETGFIAMYSCLFLKIWCQVIGVPSVLSDQYSVWAT